MSIQEFYKGKSILITGGLGFVGKVVTEKLLRSCDVANIYFIIRNKRNKNADSRLNDFKNSPIFYVLNREKPHELNKVKTLPGDLLRPELGLSPPDKELLIKNCHIVIHSAANLDIQVTMKQAIDANVNGTRKVLELSRQMKSLLGFVYVSTAYVHPNPKSGSEKLIKLPYSVNEILQINSCLNNVERLEISRSILQNHHGWYVASKAYGETAVSEENSFPTAIIRPSSVGPSWKEPEPGYNESLNSIPAFLVGIMMGVLRTFLKQTTDIIPVDFLSNTIIAAAWKISKTKPKETIIYQTTNSLNPYTTEDVEESLAKIAEFSSKKCIWYPRARFYEEGLQFYLSFYLFNFLPGVFMDFFLLITTGKSRVLKSQYKVFKAFRNLKYYTKQKFDIPTNLIALNNELTSNDRELFYLDIKEVNWKQYFKNMVTGVRKYLFREDENDLPRVQKRIRVLFYLNCLTQGFFYLIISKLVANILQCSTCSVIWLSIALMIFFNIYF